MLIRYLGALLVVWFLLCLPGGIAHADDPADWLPPDSMDFTPADPVLVEQFPDWLPADSVFYTIEDAPGSVSMSLDYDYSFGGGEWNFGGGGNQEWDIE